MFVVLYYGLPMGKWIRNCLTIPASSRNDDDYIFSLVYFLVVLSFIFYQPVLS